jgi:hypothetical protein
VSSTSSSWTQPSSSRSSRETRTSPSGPYQAGMRCPHQIWREMHQSCRLSSQSRNGLVRDSGTNTVRPSRTAWAALSASCRMATNHCRLRRGSITVPQREQCPTECSWGSTRTSSPAASSASLTEVRAARRSWPTNRSPTTSVSTPRSSMMSMMSRSWRSAMARSFGSWAGVILTAPDPNPGPRSRRRRPRRSGPGRDGGPRGRPRRRSARRRDARRWRCPRASSPPGWSPPRCRAGRRGPDQAGVRHLGAGEQVVRHGVGIGQGVDEPGQLAGGVLVLHLDVGQGGVAAHAPVDQALAAVDQPLLVQGHEHLADRLGAGAVEGEDLPVPVRRGAELLELVEDLPAGGLTPGPDPLQERLAAERVPIGALRGELLLDHVLGRDAGVVGAGDPHGVAALHPGPADDGVLDRVVERVADVQGPGDVRRRDDDGERLAVVVGLGVEQPGRAPVLVDPDSTAAGS